MQDPSFFTAVGVLWKKNWTQYIKRRYISCSCRLFLPVVFMLLLAWLRTLASKSTNLGVTPDLNSVLLTGYIDLNTDYYRYWACEPREINSTDFFGSVLCYDSGWNAPAASLGIIPDPTNFDGSGMNENQFTHFQGLISVLNASYRYEEAPGDVNYSNCNDSYRYLPFKEGWLLHYFDSESDMRSYAKKSGYGSGYNVTREIDDHRPLGAAIIFESIDDNGLEWKYTITVNSSDVADTNEKVDIYTRDTYDLYVNSAQYYVDSDYAFASLQRWLDEAIVYYIANQSSFVVYLLVFLFFFVVLPPLKSASTLCKRWKHCYYVFVWLDQLVVLFYFIWLCLSFFWLCFFSFSFVNDRYHKCK